MNEKRYAIVSVDREDEDFKCPICPFVAQGCCDCKIVETYGDTKEQLVRKVAQVMFKNASKETYLPKYIEQKEKILETAKEIVELLGVEE